MSYTQPLIDYVQFLYSNTRAPDSGTIAESIYQLRPTDRNKLEELLRIESAQNLNIRKIAVENLKKIPAMIKPTQLLVIGTITLAVVFPGTITIGIAAISALALTILCLSRPACEKSILFFNDYEKMKVFYRSALSKMANDDNLPATVKSELWESGIIF